MKVWLVVYCVYFVIITVAAIVLGVIMALLLIVLVVIAIIYLRKSGDQSQDSLLAPSGSGSNEQGTGNEPPPQNYGTINPAADTADDVELK